MTYKNLMVHLELNGDNDGVLKITADLAQRFDAKVIGIAACQPIHPLYEEGFAAGAVLAADREQIGEGLAAAETQFRAAMAGKTNGAEWRSVVTYGPLGDFLAEQGRAADLIITGKDLGPSLFDESRRVNIGDLAMRAGRPVLLVPQGITSLALQNVFVGWNDSREARRAVADAIPLLQLAPKATVLEIVGEDQVALAQVRVNDVAHWLESHEVRAEALAVAAPGMEAGRLHAALLDRRCDLLVAGAFGHTRIGEWVFGGVTSDILLDPDFCVLISH
jgi:nucleotide-binding universal stress UspA family protein